MKKNSIGAFPDFSRVQWRRRLGDIARNRKDWSLAERHYRHHLESHHDDFAIWVQLGHALKEQGKLKEAEHVYLTAYGMNSNDFDIICQIAHFYKRLRKKQDAIAFFQKAFEIEPSIELKKELNSLGARLQTKRTKLAGREDLERQNLFVEISDLLGFLKAHNTLSGIQRVQAEFIRYCLEGRNLLEGLNVYFIVGQSANINEYLEFIGRDALGILISYVGSEIVIREKLARIIDDVEDSTELIEYKAGDIYLNLGAFWGVDGLSAQHLNMKRRGAKIVAYIYDLIPITHPDYCDEKLSRDFLMAMSDGLRIFDFILCISEFTAGEVQNLLNTAGIGGVPVAVVPLAHKFSRSQSASLSTRSEPWGKNIKELENRPFVLSVSTIEARKNHILLFNIWKAFLAEGLDPPTLVLVGRMGWRIDELKEQLNLTKNLSGKIVVMHDISDVELETLYANCLFTAFPSFVEGWGLPVGESLAKGKPCIASDTASMPEVGGSFVDYVDPYDLSGSVEVFRRMMFDRDYREARETDIREHFVPRTWSDVCASLVAAIREFNLSGFVQTPFTPTLGAGVLFSPGHYTLEDVQSVEVYVSNPLRLVLAEDWYPPENFGAWMRGGTGGLRVVSAYAGHRDVVVFITILGPEWFSGQEISISASSVGPGMDKTIKRPVDGGNTIRVKLSSVAKTHRLFGSTDENGVLNIRFCANFALDGDVRTNGDPRVFAVGLVGFGYAAVDDLTARQSLLESLVIQ